MNLSRATKAERRAFLTRVFGRKMGGLSVESHADAEGIARENGERETELTDWHNRLDDPIAWPTRIGR